MEFLERETPKFISLLLWFPNLPDLNPVDYSVLYILQEKVYKTRIVRIDDLKHQNQNRVGQVSSRAAAVRQWRRRLSACVRADSGHFEH